MRCRPRRVLDRGYSLTSDADGTPDRPARAGERRRAPERGEIAATVAATRRGSPRPSNQVKALSRSASVRAAVLGGDVSRSRSPAIHRAAYRALGIEGQLRGA